MGVGKETKVFNYVYLFAIIIIVLVLVLVVIIIMAHILNAEMLSCILCTTL